MSSRRSLLLTLHCVLCTMCVSACAAKRVSLPTDAGTPLPDAATIHQEVSRACAGVKTLTAELGLSGRAGAQRLRGRALVGFGLPDSMRLEGVAPFGAPAFILAARDGKATLVLPRDGSVLRGARPEEILAALTGVSLAPADLLAVLTGCVVPAPAVEGGSTHANGWASIRLKGGAIVFLQRAGAGWQPRGARRAGWEIEYPEWSGTFPRTVRLRAVPAAGAPAAAANVDLTAQISQLETNAALGPEAFTVDVPPSAATITLDELRDAGPLRGAS